MNLRVILLCAVSLPAAADEGMWLFNQFPKDQVKQKHDFEVSDDFLENLRLASMRIGSGSGAFVSASGLVLTNHRLVSDCVPKEGFYAATGETERKCAGLEANVLVSLDNVSQQVKDAAKDAKPADAIQKRNAAIARIEKACAEKTGNSCSIVKLFSGERYDLYQYKKYSDLRLVFAPEFGIAFFGGDADNFTYPRYDLDIAFLRAYENGRPASTPHFLKWSAEGVKDAELVFAAGSPGTTSRLTTTAQLTFLRDTSLPQTISRLQSRISALREFSSKSAENQRAAQPLLSSLNLAYKSTAGKFIGLKDDRTMARKQNFEKRLRNAVANDPKLGADAAKVWDEVAAAYKSWTLFEKSYQVLESPGAQGSTLFRIARQTLRGEPSPDSAAPVDENLEIAMLAIYLEELKALGEKEAPLKAILSGKSPQQAAEEIARSKEAMQRFVKLLEDPSRKLLKKHEETIEALDVSSAERIAQYRFKLYGVSEYPDATATPRVTFGTVKGYRDKTEAPVPFATTFGGLFHRAGNQEPYKLPQNWIEAKGVLDLVMPFNFASTCDISRGSSGSPTVNRKGELVGIVFDGNIESLPLTYLYSDDYARSVHVASQGVVEVLRKLYKATRVLKELGSEGGL